MSHHLATSIRADMHRLHDARGANAAPVREAMRHHSRPFNRQHREDAAPVTGHCTRYRALHPLRGTAPDQNGCNAYGSGALHTQTRTNAESESPHHTRHRRTGEKSPPTPGAPSTTRNNRTQARTLTHLAATWAHPCACEPTWRQHGPTPAHVNPPGGNIGTPAQPPVNGGSCAQVG